MTSNPLDDRTGSELISKSLSAPLRSNESKSVDLHLVESETSRQYAKFCRMIQDSTAIVRDEKTLATSSMIPSLTTDAKSRMQASLQKCIEASQGLMTKPAHASTDDSDSNVGPLDSTSDWNLAAKLLEAGLVSESRMEAIVEHWKPSQTNSLAELLVTHACVPPEAIDEAIGAQSQWLASEGQWKKSGALIKMRERLTFEARDPSPVRSAGDQRQVTSRFTLIRKLAEGGFGTVWIARDEQLKRIVALKEMNPTAVGSERAWQRFHREAEITGHLEHPNVVPLYLFGADPVTGYPFYAMRFVGKRTLADAIAEYHDRRQSGDDSPLELHRLLTSFLGACQAIAYAHSRGVIHRDLKPENIAIDNFGQVIVLDWGLAKLSDSAELTTQLSLSDIHADIHGDDSALARTLAGEVVGTPLYMAPEQASADLANVDERTDVYGLGAILFAILTGAAPHSKSLTDQSHGNIADAIQAIADEAPPTPRTLNPQVPRDLEAICLRAMNRKTYARYSTAGELAAKLEGWVAGQRHKQQSYDNMRMEGRELRANLQSAVWDLSTNVRFMAKLPPIQGMIDAELRAEQSDDLTVWRDRLATIFLGLLGANGDYLSVAYNRFENGQIEEITRVERHSSDHSASRIVPKSRLLHYESTRFTDTVCQQNPDEVSLTMSRDCRCANSRACNMRLVAGVPVFDQLTEELYGFVTIECDLSRVLDRQANQRRDRSHELYVVAPCGTVVLHYSPTRESTVGTPFSEAFPERATEVVQGLVRSEEFIDDTNQDVYATQVGLARNEPVLLVLGDRGESKARA